MKTAAKVALGIGAGVIAVGAAAGVGALAANLAGDQGSTQQAGYGQGGPGDAGRGYGEGRGGMDTTQLASDLAEKLGVEQSTVEAALKEVMSAGRPSAGPSGQPSAQPSGSPAGGRGDQYLQTIAKGLAEKLNLDEATVLAALQEVWQDQGGPGGGQPPSGQPTQK